MLLVGVGGWGVPHPDLDVVRAVAVDVAEAESSVQRVRAVVDDEDVEFDRPGVVAGLLEQLPDDLRARALPW